METLAIFVERVRPHLQTIALVATWVGIVVVYFRRRGEWRRKQFLGQVNFSLNYVVGQTLAIRTLLEATANHVWLNDYGVRTVFAAARRTTPHQPFVLLEEQIDQDFVNRAVLNTLSERFGPTYVAAALGLGPRSARFCFGITYEQYEEMRTLKLRVILIEEQLLQQLFGPPPDPVLSHARPNGHVPGDDGDDSPSVLPSSQTAIPALLPDASLRGEDLRVVQPSHRDRLTTLKSLYDLYDQGRKPGGKAVVGCIELGVPA